MAETVYLSDGSMSVCCVDKGVFLETLIRDKLGDDAARSFLNYIDQIKEEALDKKYEAVESEYEKIADDYLAMCHEAKDNFQVIIDLLTAPRINREALKKAAYIGYDALNKNL